MIICLVILQAYLCKNFNYLVLEGGSYRTVRLSHEKWFYSSCLVLSRRKGRPKGGRNEMVWNCGSGPCRWRAAGAPVSRGPVPVSAGLFRHWKLFLSRSGRDRRKIHNIEKRKFQSYRNKEIHLWSDHYHAVGVLHP